MTPTTQPPIRRSAAALYERVGLVIRRVSVLVDGENSALTSCLNLATLREDLSAQSKDLVVQRVSPGCEPLGIAFIR
jgi:hypothetical protein